MKNSRGLCIDKRRTKIDREEVMHLLIVDQLDILHVSISLTILPDLAPSESRQSCTDMQRGLWSRIKTHKSTLTEINKTNSRERRNSEMLSRQLN
jgi:hypothetical protein